MQASQPVRPPPSRLDGHLGAVGTVALIAVLAAIVKPWGSGVGLAGSGPIPVPSPTASPTPSPSASVPPQVGFSGLAYDPTIFGNHEPEAVWGIWPAGYLVTFGFVIQLSDAVAPSVHPSPPPGTVPPTTQPAASAGAGPEWPARFDVPEGDHLLLIGINMPRGSSVVSAELGRYQTDGSLATVGIERLRAPWPHFAVVGIPTAAGDGRLDVWPSGRYRLDLTFDPDGISRSMEIRIAGPLVGP
ncbi:MAG: hypothetical protein ACXWMU_06035 [Candidatus Limnocylindrales bacterium]